MSHTGLSWSDEQATPSAVKAAGQKPFAWSDEQPEAAPGGNDVASIGVNHGAPPQPPPGLDYSRGHAPIGEHRNYSGGFLDRAESTFGEDLNHPSNFLPSPRVLLGIPGIAYDGIKQAYEQYEHRNDPQPDPAETVGHLGIPVLSGLVMHAADAIGNPVEAAPVRPEPAWKTAPSEGTEVPSILNRQPYAQPARIGNPVEAAPVRPEPAWKTAPSEGTEVPSILNRQPYAQPARIGNPVEAAPVRPEPAWKTAPSEGTEVPSILNRQPYAQPARIGNPVEAAPLATLAPGQAGSMVESVAPPGSGDPILDRLRANAARIAEEGHGDEAIDEPESTPITTNLNDDLTPALKASLRKVRAAKRIAAASH